jgi:hypothetical protein
MYLHDALAVLCMRNEAKCSKINTDIYYHYYHLSKMLLKKYLYLNNTAKKNIKKIWIEIYRYLTIWLNSQLEFE